MSGIFFEQFSNEWPLAVRQGASIAELVQTEGEWLAETHPGTVEQHRNIWTSIKTVRQSGRRDPRNHYEYVIRDGGPRGDLLGLAKMIGGQLIAHPDRETFIEGTYLDYWLFREAEEEETMHTTVGTGLLRLATNLAFRRNRTSTLGVIPLPIDVGGAEGFALLPIPIAETTVKAFTVVAERQLNPPTGLLEFMEAIEAPALLQAPAASPPEQTKLEGGLSQVYYAEFDAMRPGL